MDNKQEWFNEKVAVVPQEVFSEVQLSADIIARIDALLKEKNMTQRELAQQTGVTDSSMSHYVNGDRTPRAAVILKIASVLETSPDYLMYGTPSDSDAEIDQAIRLIARNSKQLSRDDKVRIMDILLGDK